MINNNNNNKIVRDTAAKIWAATINLIKEQHINQDDKIDANIVAGMFMSIMNSIGILYTNSISSLSNSCKLSLSDALEILDMLDDEKEKEIWSILNGENKEIVEMQIVVTGVISPKWFKKETIDAYEKRLEGIIANVIKEYSEYQQNLNKELMVVMLKDIRDAVYSPVVFAFGSMREYYNLDIKKTRELLKDFREGNKKMVSESYPAMYARRLNKKMNTY